MLERRPDTLQAAVVNNLLGFVKFVVSSRIVIRMDLVHCLLEEPGLKIH
jgi:hypothetical protein